MQDPNYLFVTPNVAKFLTVGQWSAAGDFKLCYGQAGTPQIQVNQRLRLPV
jgi:hypothetical protein